MNFIMRNLGWLLLAWFFIFMLFLISSNNSEKGPKNLTGSISTNSWEENLDALVEKLDDSELGTGEALENTASQSWVLDTGRKLSLFERFFGKKDMKESDAFQDALKSDVQAVQENVNKTNSTQDNKTSSSQEEISSDTTVEIVKPNPSPIGNLVKDTVKMQPSSPLKPTSDLQTSLPKNIPQGEIGDTYKIAVPSLKLNDRLFSKVLWYLNQGDVVKQKGKQNVNGCFEAEVISAKNTLNIGKLGYVCQKYLLISSSSEMIQDVVDGAQDNIIQEHTVLPDLSRYPKTQIGDIITLEKSGMIILKEFTDLAVGDQIDQMTNIDEMGCFVAHVYYSSLHTSKDMVWKICVQDIYK